MEEWINCFEGHTPLRDQMPCGTLMDTISLFDGSLKYMLALMATVGSSYCMRSGTDNRAATVYRLFVTAVEQYGLPSRLRCDQGRENVRVAEHKIHYRGANRGSVLVGSSVHNQRIERLWRDMHRCVTSVFYRLFYHMEQNGLLNPLNTPNLCALYITYTSQESTSLWKYSVLAGTIMA